jgi:ATP-binding protein involved in chromosome partitioning
MKIALPLVEGKLSLHFGHCDQFALVEVSDATREITATTLHTPPPHEPGVLPRWLHELGTTLVIAGGIGGRATGLFEQAGITVLPGAPALEPQLVVQAYLDGTLQTDQNICDH